MERHNLHRFCFEHNLSGPQIFVDEHGKMRVFRPRIVISGGDESGNDDALYVVKQGNLETRNDDALYVVKDGNLENVAKYRATPFSHNNHKLYRYEFESTGKLQHIDDNTEVMKVVQSQPEREHGHENANRDPFLNTHIFNDDQGLFSVTREFTYYEKTDESDRVTPVVLSQVQKELWIRKMVHDIQRYSTANGTQLRTQLGKGITVRTGHATVSADSSDPEHQQTDRTADQHTNRTADQQTDRTAEPDDSGHSESEYSDSDNRTPEKAGNNIITKIISSEMGL